jgi:hypothetical protein
MKKTTAIIFLVAFFFLLASSQLSYAFRCGSGLVSTGDSKTQVLITCGQPTTKDKSSCENQKVYRMTDKAGKVKKQKKCSNKVEVWHYNCGENDFIYKLTFENGKLKTEDTEGRGKGKSACLGK